MHEIIVNDEEISNAPLCIELKGEKQEDFLGLLADSSLIFHNDATRFFGFCVVENCFIFLLGLLCQTTGRQIFVILKN